MGIPRKKPKKPVMPWRQNILEHHKHQPTRQQRNEFPAHVVAALKREANGKCQCCFDRRDTQTHHVQPRGRNGRGVKTNGMRVCNVCHTRIHDHEDELQYWIDVYASKYGENFWYDDQDWKEYNQRTQHRTRLEAIQRARAERFEQPIDLLSQMLKRGLRAAELRVLYSMDDKQAELITNLLKEAKNG